MQFIKDFDSNDHTVIMIQVENEKGMLPSARDHHVLANKAFESNVPNELISYLKKNKMNLYQNFIKFGKQVVLKL